MRKQQIPVSNEPRSAACAADLAVIVKDLKKLEDLASSFGNASLSTPCSIHDENGALLWISQAAAGQLGVEIGQIGKSYLERIHVRDRVIVAHFLASLNDCGVDERRTAQFRTIPFGNSSPVSKWFEINFTVIEGISSRSKFGLVTYRDISDIKQNEEFAEQLRIEAEQSNVAKSQFLANISHELRTPLNAILGFSELLNSPLITNIAPEKRSEYVSLIHHSASHLLTLLNGILDMSKIENGMYEIFPECFSLSKTLENTTAMMRGQAARNSIELVTSGFDELPEIVADERAVKQIVINLLSNAIKFSDEYGKVMIIAERKARTIGLTIVDQGVGISAENLENLGKPFFQADSKYDRKYEGTGLGLSIVKGLVELHNGSISFASERGKGTTVRLTLPIHGKSGRQIPGSNAVEKITAIHTQKVVHDDGMRIIRNTA